MKKNIPESSSLANFIDRILNFIERQSEKEDIAIESLNELPSALDTCPRTSHIIRQEAKRHRLSPAAAKMLVSELNATSRMSAKIIDSDPGDTGSRDDPVLARVEYVLPQAVAERTSMTVVNLTTAVAFAGNSPLSWRGVLCSRMPDDACPACSPLDFRSRVAIF